MKPFHGTPKPRGVFANIATFLMVQLAAFVLLVTHLFTPRSAFASSETLSTDPGPACRYSVAYTAPASCPSAGSFEQRLEGTFQVKRGTMNSCADCVRGVTIELIDGSERRYRLRVAGLETMSVERSDCEELADLAAYAIEASDLPEPLCGGEPVRLGAAATPVLNWGNRDIQFAAQLRTTLVYQGFEVSPFGVWQPEAEVSNATPGTRMDSLNLSSHGLGFDACAPLTHTRAVAGGQIQACSEAMWRRFTVSTSGADSARDAAHLFTCGASITWYARLAPGVRLEISPTLRLGLNPAKVIFRDTGDVLRRFGGLESQLRIGFSWGFGTPDTPENIEQLRAVSHHGSNSFLL